MKKQRIRLRAAKLVGRFAPFLFRHISSESRHNPTFVWRVENIVISAVIAVISLPSYAMLYYLLGDNGSAGLCLLGTAAASAVPFVLRYTGNIAMARETMAILLFFILIGLSFRLGGISAPTIIWFSVCPLVGLTGGGVRPGLAWTGLGLMAIIGMYVADVSGSIPPIAVTDIRLLWLISVIGFFCTLALSFHFFDEVSSNAIKKLDKALSTINDFAIRDDLTGIYNRRESLRLAENELARSEQQEVPFCLCLIDLDHFKQINDTYGHTVGDEVLKNVSARIQHEIRKVDIFGRYGGEEFLLLLTGADTVSAVALMERVRGVIASLEHPGMGPGKQVTISAGIAQYEKGSTIAGLIVKADQALYRAKHEGRDRVALTE
jgi:diguanylate cyclase